VSNVFQTVFANPTAYGQFYSFISRQGRYLNPGQSYTLTGNAIESIRANNTDRRDAIDAYIAAGTLSMSLIKGPALTVPAVTGLSVNDSGDNSRSTIVKLFNMPMSLTLNSGVIAYASQLLCTMPLGYDLISTASVNLTITNPTVTGVLNTYTGAVGLGTVAADNTGTLTLTEQNLVPSISMSAAVAGVNSAFGVVSSLNQVFNGSVTANKVYLNLLIDSTSAAGIGATPTAMLVSGTIQFTWTIM